MKKATALLALVSVLSLVTPPKAEAGITLLAVSSGPVGLVIGGIATAGGVASLGAGVHHAFSDRGMEYALGSALATFFFGTIGLVALTLDADGNVSYDVLANGFKESYPFIKNKSTIENLAAIVKFKADQQQLVDGKKIVLISRAELDQILAFEDLTGYETQVEKMAKDLQ